MYLDFRIVTMTKMMLNSRANCGELPGIACADRARPLRDTADGSHLSLPLQRIQTFWSLVRETRPFLSGRSPGMRPTTVYLDEP